jgi:hypothetical protein
VVVEAEVEVVEAEVAVEEAPDWAGIVEVLPTAVAGVAENPLLTSAAWPA